MNSTIIDQSLLNASKDISDDQWTADLDPMLEGGMYKVAFHRQCPLQVRRIDQEGHEFGTRDMLTVRIMATPTIQSYAQIKIEISSETDLYMLFECKIDEKKFQRLRKQQSLNFGFNNMLSMLMKLLGYCDRYPEQYITVLYQSKTGVHRLTIIENMQYKKIELLDLQFNGVDEEFNKRYLSFRFSVLKAKNQKIETATKQMLALVKLKNPNLLQVIAKKSSMNTMNAHNFLNTSSLSNFGTVSIGQLRPATSNHK